MIEKLDRTVEILTGWGDSDFAFFVGHDSFILLLEDDLGFSLSLDSGSSFRSHRLKVEVYF